uniref:Mediator of RNA polymerase II transcription subunit 10 n=1 Tax=Macrostomum lignano TaxID=282301 RepID=A0A1I8JPN7_9PLAT
LIDATSATSQLPPLHGSPAQRRVADGGVALTARLVVMSLFTSTVVPMSRVDSGDGHSSSASAAAAAPSPYLGAVSIPRAAEAGIDHHVDPRLCPCANDRGHKMDFLVKSFELFRRAKAQVADVQVPLAVLKYIDEGRNPHLYTRHCLETALQRNEELSMAGVSLICNGRVLEDALSLDRSLLDRVDNHALLQLDTVWCYLCLGRLDELGDAWDRLGLAERGAGTSARRRANPSASDCTCQSNVLLLQAIGWKRRLQKPGSLRPSWTNWVDDAGLSSLMGMGFSLLESRLALRHCANDTQAAINWIVGANGRANSSCEPSFRYLTTARLEYSAASCLRLTEMGYLESTRTRLWCLLGIALTQLLTLLQDDQDRL